MSIYGRMECPGCSKITAIKYKDDAGNPVWLYQHRSSKEWPCPVMEAGDLLTWHYQRMKGRIVEAGTYTPPPREKTQQHPMYARAGPLPADPTQWLASLGS